MPRTTQLGASERHRGLRGCSPVSLSPWVLCLSHGGQSVNGEPTLISVQTAAPCISSLTAGTLDLGIPLPFVESFASSSSVQCRSPAAPSLYPQGPCWYPAGCLVLLVRGVTESADGGLCAVGSGVWGRSAWGPRGRGRHSPRGL